MTSGADDPQVRVRLDLAYDGGAFHGWAAQPGLLTVEGVLADALATLVRREVRLTVAGRTDAGVHATGQTVHLDLTRAEWEAIPRRSDEDPGTVLVRRLGGVMAAQRGAVVVHHARRVSEDFDARFSALRRRYTYRLSDRISTRSPLRRTDTAWHRGPLDDVLMHAEAAAVLGLHDFGSFCRPRPHGTTIRELQEFTVSRDEAGVLVARLTADAFCHHMVRALIGALIDVGEGRREPGWAAERLAAPSWDEKVRLAPPQGLTLSGVDYPEEAELADRAARTRAVRR
ncbi:MAG: tRNA pseudouridine(38-40) synthase TruA [Nesterenkonia sp.]|uniref:tRNA pseudouridine(38-40) synthase TruA n=1 Tax=Nesterenkonia marinintestina TaxID=2979865 RepID=UPI0021C16857|nr:tRNA pseudouridine(38-40) synthase TruA [Nesterenkonia sp. GX14115]MDO5493588.1 tRNA pseudouridine(38-40) synthase TruA [Nesterenkonia sp.]